MGVMLHSIAMGPESSAKAEHMDTTTAVTISAADLADGAADAPLVGEGGTVDRPMLIVDLDDAPASVLDRAAYRAAMSDRLLVGRATTSPDTDAFGPLLDALDLTYVTGPDPEAKTVVGTPDVDTSLATFFGAVTQNPHASLV
ncbi:hypothetical protein Q8814_25420, partial [Rhodococcus sp. CC-R104]|nr:hypothetical protein [Rhodococcus sp. CC-R104]